MYPEASKGLKKVLWGEAIQLISLLALTVIAQLAGIAQAAVLACSLIFLAVSAVLSFVGLVQAGKDDGCFRDAWVCLIAYVIGTIISSIVWYRNGTTGDYTWIQSIIDLIVTSLVFLGMMNLLRKANLEEGYNKTKTAFTVYLVASIISVAAEIALLFIQVPEELNNAEDVIIIVLGFVTAALLVVSYIMYLSALGRTSAQLSDK